MEEYRAKDVDFKFLLILQILKPHQATFSCHHWSEKAADSPVNQHLILQLCVAFHLIDLFFAGQYVCAARSLSERPYKPADKPLGHTSWFNRPSTNKADSQSKQAAGERRQSSKKCTEVQTFFLRSWGTGLECEEMLSCSGWKCKSCQAADNQLATKLLKEIYPVSYLICLACPSKYTHLFMKSSAVVWWIHSKVEKGKDAVKAERKTVNHTGAKRSRVWSYRPGVLGGVRAQYLDCHQERATFSHIEGELQVGQVLRALDFTQVHLTPEKGRRCWNTITLPPTPAPTTHFSRSVLTSPNCPSPSFSLKMRHWRGSSGSGPASAPGLEEARAGTA